MKKVMVKRLVYTDGASPDRIGVMPMNGQTMTKEMKNNEMS